MFWGFQLPRGCRGDDYGRKKERGRLGDTDITGEKAAFVLLGPGGRNLAAYETGGKHQEYGFSLHAA